MTSFGKSYLMHHEGKSSLNLEFPLHSTSSLTVVFSQVELIDLINTLGDKQKIAVISGGILVLTYESIRLLKRVKDGGYIVVLICSDYEQAEYLQHFQFFDHIIIYSTQESNLELELPLEIQDYVIAKAQPDRWILQQLQESFQGMQGYDLANIFYERTSPGKTKRTQLSFWDKEYPTAKTINTIKDARVYIRGAKRSGKKVVLVTGCFDLLHIGHVWFLKNAKAKGEVLVVGVEDDKRVLNFKGRLINNVRNRYEMIEALRFVDLVFMITGDPSWQGLEEFYEHLCRTLRPNIRATHEEDPFIEQKRTQIEKVNGTLRIVSDYPHGHSTFNDFGRVLYEYSGSIIEDPKIFRVRQIVDHENSMSDERNTLLKWKNSKGYLEYPKLVSYQNEQKFEPMKKNRPRQLPLSM